MTRSTRILALGLLAGFAFAAAWAAPAPPDTEETVKDRAAFLPQRKYQPLPGKTVGVLVSDVTKFMAHDGRGGPQDAIAFSRDVQSYRWMYTPALGKAIITNLRVRVGEKGDRTVVYPSLNMANAETVKTWGVNKAYALVEVDVNDGQGAPADESFVVTGMKVLDGSKEYPIVVADAIDRCKKKYKSYVEDQKKAIDTAMDEAAKKALKDKKPTGPRETNELFYVTWMPESERLRVAFRTTITDGAYQTGGGPAEGGPVARRPPREGNVRWGTSFGVEFGRAYEVSRGGAVVKTLTLPVESFQKELPAPPAPFIGRDPPPLPIKK